MQVEDPSSLPLARGGGVLRFLITIMMCGSPLPCSRPLEGMNKQGSPGLTEVDVIRQPCFPRFWSAPWALQSPAPMRVAGRLQRVDAVLGVGHLGKINGLRPSNPACRAQLTSSLSLLRLYLIMGRIQPSPPSWRKWIFSCWLWPILMDMYTHKLKWVILTE